MDESDRSIEETALREAYEEIGLRREDVRLLGRLDDARTLVSNFIIHPVVGWVSNALKYHINPAEVENLMEVPLDLFYSPLTQKKPLFEFEGRTYETPSYRFNGEVIWGATARIMENFMDLVGESLRLPDPPK